MTQRLMILAAAVLTADEMSLARKLGSNKNNKTDESAPAIDDDDQNILESVSSHRKRDL